MLDCLLQCASICGFQPTLRFGASLGLLIASMVLFHWLLLSLELHPVEMGKRPFTD